VKKIMCLSVPHLRKYHLSSLTTVCGIIYRSFEFVEINKNKMTRSVSIATDSWLDGWGSVLGSGKRLRHFLQGPDWLSGSISVLSDMYRGLFSSGVKRMRPEAVVEFRNCGVYLHSSYVSMAWCLIKLKNNFMLPLLRMEKSDGLHNKSSAFP
jgi:hypothetical protein